MILVYVYTNRRGYLDYSLKLYEIPTHTNMQAGNGRKKAKKKTHGRVS
jgi:hypothetical protein